MTYFLYAVISILIGIGFIIGISTRASRDMYSDVTNQLSCIGKIDTKNNECGLWEDNVCFKGKLTDKKCVQKSDSITTILVLLTFLSFVSFVIFVILGFVFIKR